jgi:hypothetical protein
MRTHVLSFLLFVSVFTRAQMGAPYGKNEFGPISQLGPSKEVLATDVMLIPSVNTPGQAGVPEYGQGKSAILKSLIIPGWGLYATNSDAVPKTIRYAWFLFTPLSYGLIAAGINDRSQAEKAYNDYLTSTDVNNLDDLYETANGAHERIYGTIKMGVAIYLFQAGLTYIHGALNDHYRKRNGGWNNQTSLRILPAYNPICNQTELSLRLNF